MESHTRRASAMTPWRPKAKRRALWTRLGGLKPNGWKSGSRRLKNPSSWRNTTSHKPLKRRIVIRRRSRACDKRMKTYREQAKIFLAQNPKCAVLFGRRSTEIHHRFGRRGRLLLWQPGWLAVSALAHAAIHRLPAEARRQGLIGPVGTWNNYQKAVEYVNGSLTI